MECLSFIGVCVFQFWKHTHKQNNGIINIFKRNKFVPHSRVVLMKAYLSDSGPEISPRGTERESRFLHQTAKLCKGTDAKTGTAGSDNKATEPDAK